MSPVKFYSIWNSEVAVKLPNSQRWKKSTILKHMSDILQPFNLEVMDKNSDVHIVTIQEVSVRRRNMHRIKIMSTSSATYSERYYLWLDEDISEVLTPGIKVNDVLAVLGGHLDMGQHILYAGNPSKNSCKMIQFGQGALKDYLHPYGVSIETSHFQLLYRTHGGSTLLEVMPKTGYSILKQYGMFEPVNPLELPQHKQVTWTIEPSSIRVSPHYSLNPSVTWKTLNRKQKKYF